MFNCELSKFIARSDHPTLTPLIVHLIVIIIEIGIFAFPSILPTGRGAHSLISYHH